MSSNDSDEDGSTDNGNLFKEPDDFYEPEKPATFVEHHLHSGQILKLRLVGHNPLWGHLLWNAGRITADYLEDHAAELVKDKTVLELGAGAGLPSLVCALEGALKVVVTDYPDPDLVENLRYNIIHSGIPTESTIVATGYLWGNATDTFGVYLDTTTRRFDLLILADILFNHSEHEKLVTTMQLTLKKSAEARALVFFTPYRPWLLEKDMRFFDIARARGFVVQKIFETVMDKVMFENDPGDEVLRRTVFGYDVRWEMY